MKERIQKQMTALLEQAKNTDKLVAEMAQKIKQSDKLVAEMLEKVKQSDTLLAKWSDKLKQFDKASARAAVDVLKSQGQAEIGKAKEKLQGQVREMSSELLKTSEKLKIESEKVRGKVKDTLLVMKQQLKTMAENEKQKRRGGN